VIQLLDLPSIRNPIIAGIYAKLHRPVIRTDQGGDIPEYPYVTYSITSPYIDLFSHDIECCFDRDGTFIRQLDKPVECVFSFTAYDENEDDVQALCFGIVEYVTRTGRDDLKDFGIVVVNVSNVQNRSVLLTEHYERRWGVDVRFRVVDRSEMQDNYIETAEITNQGG